MERGHIRDRSGPNGPAFEVRIVTGSGPERRTITRSVRWQGDTPTTRAEWKQADRTSRSDAEKLRTRLLAELDQTGPSHAGPDGTFRVLLERWFQARSPGWSVTTTREHRRIIDRYLATRVGKLTVSTIRGDHLDQLYAELLTSGGRGGAPLGAATVQRTHVVVHSALAQAVRWGWIVANPADRATSPRGQAPEPTPPPPELVGKVLAAAEANDPALALYLHLAAITGARRGELCALRWANVDHGAGQLTISRALAVGTGIGAVVDQPTKTRRTRIIALPAGTLARLQAAHDAARDVAEACGGHLPDSGYVFAMEVDGTRPRHPQWFTRRVRELVDATVAEGPATIRVTIRHLRHYVATQLLTAGVPIHTVARRLGHARTSTTLDIYGHALAADDQAAAGHLQYLLDR